MSEMKWSQEEPGRTDWVPIYRGFECFDKAGGHVVVVQTLNDRWVVSWAMNICTEYPACHICLMDFSTAEAAKKHADECIVPGPKRDEILKRVDADYRLRQEVV
jgi:hypothetical protein